MVLITCFTHNGPQFASYSIINHLIMYDHGNPLFLACVGRAAGILEHPLGDATGHLRGADWT